MTATLGAAGEATSEDTGPLATRRATLSLCRPAGGRLALASLLGTLALAATIALMATSAWLLSRAAQRPGEAALGLAIVAVQAFALVRGFARYAERLVGHDAAFRLLGEVRVHFYDHMATLAPTGLPVFSRGELVTRMVADVDGLQELLLRVVPPTAIAALVGIGTVVGVWAMLPAAGAVILAALVLAVTLVPWCTSVASRRASAHEADLRGAMGAAYVDLVEGAAELTVLDATDGTLAALDRLDAALQRATARRAWLEGLGSGLSTLLAGLAAVGSLAVGVAAVRDGELPGVWLATLAVVPLAAFELIAPLPLAAQSLNRARRATARLLDVLETAPPVVDPPAPVAVGSPPHEVRAIGAAARYPRATRHALEGLDLTVAPGRCVAVVGESGAGKSTLAALLVDFLATEEGTLTLDGVPYAQRRGEDVREVVGLVEQVPHLFAATLAANLRIARPDASDAELWAVLERVGLGHVAGAWPDGLATSVGRHGARLSGGERHRVGAARALLARWPVLVLDEPTEHLDHAAADALLTTLLDDDPDRATMLITHRLVGLDRADEVLVLDQGRVVERGTPAELLASGGWLARWAGGALAADAGVGDVGGA